MVRRITRDWTVADVGRRLPAALVVALMIIAGFGAYGALDALKTGARRAADSAALAAAGYLLGRPDDHAGATLEAVKYARANVVLGRAAELREEDVTFDTEAATVEVRVRIPVVRVPSALSWTGIDDLVITATGAAEGRTADRGPIKRLRIIDATATR
jgi:hypothetical protein